MLKSLFASCAIFLYLTATAQTGADSLFGDTDPTPVNNESKVIIFKSPRVIMAHSTELLPGGVMDFRILHRFGTIRNGLQDMFGLDYANMRMSFDFGVTDNINVGVGRSTFNKELDLFVKARLLKQSTGDKASPLSIAAVVGYNINTTKVLTPIDFKDRTAIYAQLLLARKFSDHFALQLAPTFLNRNVLYQPNDKKTVVALGVGARTRVSRTMHLLVDAFPTFSGVDKNVYEMPMSVGVDIETGGHVFQLHFSNSRGMNENAFLTTTTQKWGRGDVSFGFNLSRIFTVKKNKVAGL